MAMPPLVRRLLAVAFILVAPLLTAYALFPVLAPWLIARQAAAVGLTALEVRIDRPGLNAIHLPKANLVGSGFSLDLEHVDVTWSRRSLSAGRLLGVRVARASLSVASGGPAPMPEVPGDALASEEAGLFVALPFDTAHIDDLSLLVPALQAAGRGTASFEEDRLRLRLEGLSPAEAEGVVLEGELSADGGVALRLARIGGADPPFLNVTSRLPHEALDMVVDVRLGGFMLDLVATVAGWPAGTGTVAGQWQLTLPWPLAEGVRFADLAGSGTLGVDWTAADGRVALHGLAGTAALANGRLEADLDGRVEATFGALRLGLRPRHVEWQPVPLAVGIRGEVEAHAAAMQLSASGSGSIAVAADDAVRYALSGALTGLLDWQGRRFAAEADATARLDAEGLEGDVRLSSGVLSRIPVAVRYRTRDARVELTVRHPLSFARPLLAGFLPDWQEPYDLDSGRLDLDLSFARQGSAPIGGEGTISLSEVAARAGPVAIRGLAGPLRFTLEPDGRPPAVSAALSAALVDFGVPMRAARTQVSGSPGRLSVHDTALETLGGRIEVAPFTFVDLATPAETVVTLDDLDLAEVLALEGEHITGTGRLDGTLPLRFAGGGFSVAGGRVLARAPGGELHLQPALASAVTQPGLELALTALTDFRYELLEASVDYSAQGDLNLGVRLHGSNPAVERGRAIHFNLNVSENLPVLFQSLRLKDEFTRRIERRFR
ncbi:MAG TPA: YdbH domain-containing protein [Pseudomonadales bacterium]